MIAGRRGTASPRRPVAATGMTLIEAATARAVASGPSKHADTVDEDDQAAEPPSERQRAGETAATSMPATRRLLAP
jgi:hypothetical protein